MSDQDGFEVEIHESIDSARLRRMERKLDDQSRAIAFILASIAKQPAMISQLQELLDRLGREMPPNVIPANAI